MALYKGMQTYDQMKSLTRPCKGGYAVGALALGGQIWSRSPSSVRLGDLRSASRLDRCGSSALESATASTPSTARIMSHSN